MKKTEHKYAQISCEVGGGGVGGVSIIICSQKKTIAYLCTN